MEMSLLLSFEDSKIVILEMLNMISYCALQTQLPSNEMLCSFSDHFSLRMAWMIIIFRLQNHFDVLLRSKIIILLLWRKGGECIKKRSINLLPPRGQNQYFRRPEEICIHKSASELLCDDTILHVEKLFFL